MSTDRMDARSTLSVAGSRWNGFMIRTPAELFPDCTAPPQPAKAPSQPESGVRQPDVEFQVDVAVALQLLARRVPAGRRPVVRLEPHRQFRLLVEVHDAPVAVELAVVHLVHRLHAHARLLLEGVLP